VKYALESQQDALFTIVSLKFSLFKFSVIAERRLDESNLMRSNLNAHELQKISQMCLKRKTFIVYFFRLFLSGFVLVNDPRTSLPLFIFLNVYWV
jgi:hypothetical protein